MWNDGMRQRGKGRKSQERERGRERERERGGERERERGRKQVRPTNIFPSCASFQVFFSMINLKGKKNANNVIIWIRQM